MIPNFRYNVLGFVTDDIKINTFASTVTGGKETNQLYVNVRGEAVEAVERGLGFSNMVGKLDINSPGDNEKMRKAVLLRIADGEKIIFQRNYVSYLNRGYEQKTARRMALKDSQKYRQEEISYMEKNILVK